MRHIHVIVNPASGQNQPILNTLNDVWGDTDIRWEVSITRERGDGLRLARESVDEVDMVAVYGGDDTISEVAEGLCGTETPLAILPGGTANIMALELGIPLNLTQAARLIAGGGRTEAIDMGRSGEDLFLVRLSLGLAGEMVVRTDRERKERLGALAYTVSALQALSEPLSADYTLKMPGETVTVPGIACFVANAGTLALQGVTFSSEVRVDDGMLDVIVLSLPVIRRLARGEVVPNDPEDGIPYYQVESITVSAEPRQAAAIDGEDFGHTPVTAHIVPDAVRVLLPK